jgi:hypothetical protein
MSNATKKDPESVAAATVCYDAFVREVAAQSRVWTLRDSGGIPTATGSNGTAMPFWSSLSRVEQVIATVPAYSDFEPSELSWDRFRDRWLPGLERDGLLVGINWSGPRALGYDLEPQEVRTRIEDKRCESDELKKPNNS